MYAIYEYEGERRGKKESSVLEAAKKVLVYILRGMVWCGGLTFQRHDDDGRRVHHKVVEISAVTATQSYRLLSTLNQYVGLLPIYSFRLFKNSLNENNVRRQAHTGLKGDM